MAIKMFLAIPIKSSLACVLMALITLSAKAAMPPGPTPAPIAPLLTVPAVEGPVMPAPAAPIATAPVSTTSRVNAVPVKIVYVSENQPVQIVDSQGRLVQVIYLRKSAQKTN